MHELFACIAIHGTCQGPDPRIPAGSSGILTEQMKKRKQKIEFLAFCKLKNRIERHG
jgi:hypothetical protein